MKQISFFWLSIASALATSACEARGSTAPIAQSSVPIASTVNADGAVARAVAPSTALAPDGPNRAAAYEHALLVSVDGLRSDALRAVAGGELPNFRRLSNGASTLNARTDPDYTITLPNHTDMITGRPVLGAAGHGWVKNDDAEPGETLHKNHGAYVASMFDVAHDRGFHTALFAGKSKFAIYDASYGASSGTTESKAGAAEAADHVAGAGSDAAAPASRASRKLDTWKFASKTEEISDLVIANLGVGEQRSLVFAHYAITDLTGHANGWDVTPGSRYMRAVAAVDKDLGRILDAIEASDRLRGKTAIVLTADHGGGAPFRSHDQTQMWVDYIIPFLVWTGDGSKGGDLYAINAEVRRDPGLTSPRLADAGLPPIRNGDAGNLLLSLLGLPAVPDSTFDARQELKIR